MEQIQVIAEKEMTGKLLKQFSLRTFIYSFLYLGVVAILFIFEPFIKSVLWSLLLVFAINVLFLMMLSKLATTDAFDGINTTSAPKKSLDRIATVAATPMFIFTAIFSFMDVIFFHAVIDISKGYTISNLTIFGSIVLINIFIWCLVVNIYEKRLLRKYLTLEEEK